MNGLYSKEVMKHFRNPHNYGKMKNPSGCGQVGNVVCGDVMRLCIRVKNNKITNAKFETFGCAVAIAVSSVLTDMVKGKTIKEALKITHKNIIKSVGSLPQFKIHCSVLAADALLEAIYDYLVKNKLPIPNELEKSHIRIKRIQKSVPKTTV